MSGPSLHNVTCKHQSLKPHNQLLGQLPLEQVTPTSEKVRVDYAGPFLIKYECVRKHTIAIAHIFMFVCLSVKAVHLELVSDLTTEAFIAALCRFISRYGCPSLIWSDHGTNFVGANRELKELSNFLCSQQPQGTISVPTWIMPFVVLVDNWQVLLTLSLPKWRSKFWQRCLQRNRKTDLYKTEGSGRAAASGLPIKKWPGMWVLILSSSAVLTGIKGRLFKHAST